MAQPRRTKRAASHTWGQLIFASRIPLESATRVEKAPLAGCLFVVYGASGHSLGLAVAPLQWPAEKASDCVILSEAKNLSVHWTYTKERFFASLRMTIGVFPGSVKPSGGI